MNRQDVLEIIARHRATLAADFGVKSLALLGSVVRMATCPREFHAADMEAQFGTSLTDSG